MTGWALDLGTTNSALARWDDSVGRPVLVELPAVSRKSEATDALEAPRLVPSAVDFVQRLGLLDRLGSWPPLARHLFLGRRAFIGRQALERNDGNVHVTFVPAFKPALSAESLRPLARVGRRTVSAREAARAFLRELLCEAKRETGHRARDLVVTSPVTAFETYRAEVQRVLQQLGVHRVRFIDEPVAAALGYGISLTRERTVLVVDVGGGTMHVVLARLSPGGAMGGEAIVQAKRGHPLGGNAVDGWVLQDVCRQMGHDLASEDDDEVTLLWRRLMLAEACRIKEAVYFEDGAAFLMDPPPPAFRTTPRRAREGVTKLTRKRLREILDENGFYRCLAHPSTRCSRKPGCRPAISTTCSWSEARLCSPDSSRSSRSASSDVDSGHGSPSKRSRTGAACFAADRMDALDFIVHDYAFVTHDAKTGEEQHTIIVPRGTRFPTPYDFWKRQVVPTCSLGEPETIFKLLVCEVARADGGERRFVWDAAGDIHKVGGSSGEARTVVPLNASSPTLGYLDPPHSPRDRRPRLEIAFGVNSERWLVATVRDLLAQRELMREEPVVRLI